MSQRAIADRLNADGVPAVGGSWHRGTVIRSLSQTAVRRTRGDPKRRRLPRPFWEGQSQASTAREGAALEWTDLDSGDTFRVHTVGQSPGDSVKVKHDRLALVRYRHGGVSPCVRFGIRWECGRAS